MTRSISIRRVRWTVTKKYEELQDPGLNHAAHDVLPLQFLYGQDGGAELLPGVSLPGSHQDLLPLLLLLLPLTYSSVSTSATITGNPGGQRGPWGLQAGHTDFPEDRGLHRTIRRKLHRALPRTMPGLPGLHTSLSTIPAPLPLPPRPETSGGRRGPRGLQVGGADYTDDRGLHQALHKGLRGTTEIHQALRRGLRGSTEQDKTMSISSI